MTPDNLNIEAFIRDIHYRLKNKLCIGCSIHEAKIGPSLIIVECQNCHNDMQASAKVDE